MFQVRVDFQEDSHMRVQGRQYPFCSTHVHADTHTHIVANLLTHLIGVKQQPGLQLLYLALYPPSVSLTHRLMCWALWWKTWLLQDTHVLKVRDKKNEHAHVFQFILIGSSLWRRRLLMIFHSRLSMDLAWAPTLDSKTALQLLFNQPPWTFNPIPCYPSIPVVELWLTHKPVEKINKNTFRKSHLGFKDETTLHVY